MPWRFRSRRICSRNLRGMRCCAAMSAIIILSVPASAISALKAYRAFCEITCGVAPETLSAGSNYRVRAANTTVCGGCRFSPHAVIPANETLAGRARFGAILRGRYSKVSQPMRTSTGTAASAAAQKTAVAVLAAISVCHLLNDVIQSLIVALYPMIKQSLALDFRQIGLITFTFTFTASVL